MRNSLRVACTSSVTATWWRQTISTCAGSLPARNAPRQPPAILNRSSFHPVTVTISLHRVQILHQFRLPLRVVMHGSYLPGHEVWLENRQMDGKAGLMLIAPLRLDDGAVVLINRGFAARDPNDRERLPEVARPAGDVAVEGLALEQTSRVLPLGEEAPVGAPRPLVWQNLDYDAFERATGLSVSRWVVQQTGGPDDRADDEVHVLVERGRVAFERVAVGLRAMLQRSSRPAGRQVALTPALISCVSHCY